MQDEQEISSNPRGTQGIVRDRFSIDQGSIALGPDSPKHLHWVLNPRGMLGLYAIVFQSACEALHWVLTFHSKR